MHKISRLAACLVAGALISATAISAEKTKPAFTVNGQAVSQNAFEALLIESKAQGIPEGSLDGKVREELIQRELFAQEARKKGLDKNPNLQGQVELARQALLARAFMVDYVQSRPISEEALKAEYEKVKLALGETEYKARHILLTQESEAKAVIAKLEKGEKFSELAKQSIDPGSKEKGGDLGWSTPAAYVPAFGEALRTLKKGEFTQSPIATQFGFHVIQLDDTRAMNLPSYEQLKPQLQDRLTKEMINKLITDLRSKAKIGN